MRKIISMLLLTICVIALSSCDGAEYKKNEWFTDDKLEQCGVSNLPTISCCSDYYYNNKSWVYFNASYHELEDYANIVYEYLKSQDFEYLGTRGHQKASLAGAFASYYFKEIETFEDCYTQTYSKQYIFVYSNGNVKECTPFKYENPIEKTRMKNEMKISFEKSNGKMNSKTETKKSNEKVNPKNEFEIDEVIGDVRLGMLVDETLKAARTTSIDSLLAGFNYGLDEAVG